MMRKIGIRVHYNVTLFCLVDSLSTWDHFVNDHIRKWFEQKYGVTPEDQEILTSYADIRRKLEWEKEIELFNWAYAGFPENEQFSPLLPFMTHFEMKRDGKDSTLQSELEQATDQLATLTGPVEKKWKDFTVTELSQKFARLFESPSSPDVLPCYLTYSPTTHVQGGANGEGIYTEVVLTLPQSVQISESAGVILHEYLHKVLQPSRFFLNLSKEVYEKEYSEIYRDSYAGFVEEVIIYSLCDVLTLKKDPLERAQRYAEKNNHEMAILWRSVHDVVPILNAYDANGQKAEVIEKLDTYFRKLVSKTL